MGHSIPGAYEDLAKTTLEEDVEFALKKGRKRWIKYNLHTPQTQKSGGEGRRVVPGGADWRKPPPIMSRDHRPVQLLWIDTTTGRYKKVEWKRSF